MTCLWYVVGVDGPTDTGKQWTNQPGIDLGRPADFSFQPHVESTEASLLFQYICALQQITAIVTCASCYVYPNNSFEGICNVLLLIYGLLFGGSLVSFFSTTMTQRALTSYERNKQLDALREYIRQRALPPALALQMYKAARTRLDRSTPLTEDKVPAIALLPHELHQAVYRETRLRYLLTYTLFSQWSMISREPAQHLCLVAVTFAFITSGDVVFVSKEVATSAFHTVKGSLTYTNRSQGPSRSMYGDTNQTRVVLPCVWVAEAALWAHWSHMGKLFANGDATVLAIETAKLPGIVSKDIKIASMTAKYARAFHKRLIAAEPPYADWPDDILVPDTESSDLLGSEVCLGLLRRYAKTPACLLSTAALSELEDEVCEGKCAIQDDGQGSLERIVSVLAVRLERSDGCILVEVGRWKDGRATADSVQLPGTKRSAGELQNVATKRVLDNTLRDFDGLLTFDRIERTSFYKESKIGLRTKYSRTTYIAKVNTAQSPQLPRAMDKSDSNPEAYFLPDSNGTGKLKVFAWITPQMMLYFNETLEGAEELADWVSGLTQRDTDSEGGDV